MSLLLTAIIVVLMFTMSVLPLFIVMYLGNQRSRVGPIVLAMALLGGALMGTTMIATA